MGHAVSVVTVFADAAMPSTDGRYKQKNQAQQNDVQEQSALDQIPYNPYYMAGEAATNPQDIKQEVTQP